MTYELTPAEKAEIDKMAAAGPPSDPILAAKQLLKAAGIFYHNCDEELDDWGRPYTINFNDVWCWASGWGEEVPEAELPEVARLYRDYGWCGVLYWMSERNDKMRSEFHDNNRMIEFVRNEERIRREVPDYNKRAYHKTGYTIGIPKRPWWKRWQPQREGGDSNG